MARYFAGNSASPIIRQYRLTLDNQDWLIEALYSAIASLSFSYNWQADGDITPDTAAEMGGAILASMKMSIDMTGMIMPFAGTYSDIPEGAFPCDGRSLNTLDYPDLAAKLGAFYPDDETFQIPDLRARFIIGMNDSGHGTHTGARPAHTWLSTGGAESINLTVGQLPAHTHTDSGHTHTDSGHTHGYVPALPNVTTIGAGVPQATAVPGAAATAPGFASIQSASANIQNTGNGDAVSIVNPFYTLAFVIFSR